MSKKIFNTVALSIDGSRVRALTQKPVPTTVGAYLTLAKGLPFRLDGLQIKFGATIMAVFLAP